MIINHRNKFLCRQTGKGIGSFVKNLITSDFVKGNLKSVGRLLYGKAKDITKNILLPAASKVAIEVGTNLKIEAAEKVQNLVKTKLTNLQGQVKNEQLKKILNQVTPTVTETSQNIISNLMAGSGFKIIPANSALYQRRHWKK